MKKNKFLKEVKRNIARLVVNQRKKLNEQQAACPTCVGATYCPCDQYDGTTCPSSAQIGSTLKPTYANTGNVPQVGDVFNQFGNNTDYVIIQTDEPNISATGMWVNEQPGASCGGGSTGLTCYGCENGQIITDSGFNNSSQVTGICGTINGVTMYDDQNHPSLANCGGGTDPNVSDLGCCEWCDEYGPGGPMAGTQTTPPAGCEDWMCGDPDHCPSEDGGRGEDPIEPKGKRGRDKGRSELRERFQKLANIIK
tara:strand:- start:241 stop:999 length:759 start_codon:yes stop_codon:yes gene_type:complete